MTTHSGAKVTYEAPRYVYRFNRIGKLIPKPTYGDIIGGSINCSHTKQSLKNFNGKSYMLVLNLNNVKVHIRVTKAPEIRVHTFSLVINKEC